LGQEIAVTGSVARGVADEHSDVEINLWVGAMPEVEQASAWLEQAGATDILWHHWDLGADDFRWIIFRFQGVWIEAGWAAIEPFDAFVWELAGDAYTDHARLQMGWTVRQAIALRTHGRLADWQAMLAVYPAGLAQRVIAEQTTVWTDPHVPGVRWALAGRGERMGLALRFVWDMQNLLRVLFAVNHMWDQDLKWTDKRSLAMPIKPEDLSARIDAMFTLTDLLRAVATNQRLIVETLELAADQGFEVHAALQSMRAGLRAGLESSGLA